MHYIINLKNKRFKIIYSQYNEFRIQWYFSEFWNLVIPQQSEVLEKYKKWHDRKLRPEVAHPDAACW